MSEPELIDSFVGWTTDKLSDHPFYSYEPWDGPDGVAPRHTEGGSKFQKAMQMCVCFLRMAIAGNQIGKTYDRAMEVIIMITGEIPYSMRVDDGVDTKIPRPINENNIRRWGRRDKETGEIIDHNFEATEDPTWDCGTIIGVGKYPKEKINKKRGGEIWVCTLKQARDDVWVDLFKELIPDQCVDITKGTEGYSLSEHIFYLSDNCKIKLKTYEQGYMKVEALKVWHILLDEEPPDRKYYTGCLTHAKSISFSFTPLRGMSWAYTDLYLAGIEGDKDIAVFQATQYDCPFNTDADVQKIERRLRTWERDPKIYGKFGQQEGRPYYDFDLCKQYIKDFKAVHSYARITPIKSEDTVRRLVRTKMRKIPVKEYGEDVWCIIEDRDAVEAYWLSIDCAKGADDPDAVLDKSAAYIFRKPKVLGRDNEGEDIMENEGFPVCVAYMHTTEVTENYARLILYGAIYYNHALLIAETKGDDGSAFHAELRDYPHWFTMIVVRQRDRKLTKNIGFDTNARTRTPLFNKLRKYINAHEDESGIPHLALLLEAQAIIHSSGRPDHPKLGTSDCVIGWCLGLWVYEETPHQIKNYGLMYKKEKTDTKFTLQLGLNHGVGNETKPILGSSRGMDRRRF